MKQLIIIISFACSFAVAQLSSHMYTSGNRIFDVCGNPLVLRGVNHAVFNWGWSSGYDVFDEIEQTGSNCVRIPWYTSSAAGGGAPGYNDLSLLDSAITRCARWGMIPIVDLHDQTCQNSPSGVIGLTTFFKQPAVLEIVDKHKAYLIINFANEALYVMWGGSASVYKETYFQVIDSLRSYDIHVPIMIDAPDCGQHLDVFGSVGSDIKNHDPDTNIIFSGHAYWYGYASAMDSVAVRGKLQNMMNTGLPFVLGEIANLQSDGSNECAYTLTYKPLLRICEEMNVSWIAWSWDHDVCAARQISVSGNFSSLTTYGNDIVHNPQYGLMNAVRSPYLLNQFSCASGMGMEPVDLNITMVQQGGFIEWVNHSAHGVQYTLYDMLGRPVGSGYIQAGESVQFISTPGQMRIMYMYNQTGARSFKVY